MCSAVVFVQALLMPLCMYTYVWDGRLCAVIVQLCLMLPRCLVYISMHASSRTVIYSITSKRKHVNHTFLYVCTCFTIRSSSEETSPYLQSYLDGAFALKLTTYPNGRKKEDRNTYEHHLCLPFRCRRMLPISH